MIPHKWPKKNVQISYVTDKKILKIFLSSRPPHYLEASDAHEINHISKTKKGSSDLCSFFGTEKVWSLLVKIFRRECFQDKMDQIWKTKNGKIVFSFVSEHRATLKNKKAMCPLLRKVVCMYFTRRKPTVSRRQPKKRIMFSVVFLAQWMNL